MTPFMLVQWVAAIVFSTSMLMFLYGFTLTMLDLFRRQVLVSKLRRKNLLNTHQQENPQALQEKPDA